MLLVSDSPHPPSLIVTFSSFHPSKCSGMHLDFSLSRFQHRDGVISLTLNGACSDLRLFAQDKSQASKVHCGGLPCKNLMAMNLTDGGREEETFKTIY